MTLMQYQKATMLSPHAKQAITEEAPGEFAKLSKAIYASQHHIKARAKQ